VAIVHYWLIGMRGGEKVVEALCGLYPEADVFTNVYDPKRISPGITSHRVQTTFVNRMPFARSLYRFYLPWMPLAIEQLDLRGYDLVISLESGPAKGIIPPLDGVHVCYCLSPMRYAWDMYHDYLERSGWLTRRAMRPIMHYFRLWDRCQCGSRGSLHHSLETHSAADPQVLSPRRRDSAAAGGDLALRADK